MKINLIQTDIVWGDPQANCAHLDKLLADAAPADLYVLPEMFTTGFATLPDATVEHEPSAGLAWMQHKAKELNAAIQRAVERYNAEEGMPFALSLSVGLVRADAADQPVLDKCVQAADATMYENKRVLKGE